MAKYEKTWAETLFDASYESRYVDSLVDLAAGANDPSLAFETKTHHMCADLAEIVTSYLFATGQGHIMDFDPTAMDAILRSDLPKDTGESFELSSSRPYDAMLFPVPDEFKDIFYGSTITSNRAVCGVFEQDLSAFPYEVQQIWKSLKPFLQDYPNDYIWQNYIPTRDALMHGRDGSIEDKEELFKAISKLYLYVCAVNRDIETVYVPKKELTVKKARRRNISLNERHLLGGTVGADLRSRIVTQGEGTSAATGRTVRPHVRRAHFHTFLTGPMDGPRDAVVKWIPPILVNAKKEGMENAWHAVQGLDAAKEAQKMRPKAVRGDSGIKQ